MIYYEKNHHFESCSRSGHCHHSRIAMHRRRERAPTMPFYLESETTRHLETKACCNIGPRQDGHILEKAMLPRHQVLPLGSTKSCGHWNQPSNWKGVRIDPNKSKQAVLCHAQGPPVVTIGDS